MNFIALVGDMGSGKTCFATAVLRQSALMGRRVGSNYKLSFDDLNQEPALMSFEEIQGFPDSFKDMDYVADELGTGADSYDFMSTQSKNIGKLVTQIRKRKCRVYYTVQRYNFIARRLRQMTDGFILFTDMDAHENHLAKGFVCAGLFDLEFRDSEGLKTKKNEVFDGRPFWNFYDTNEIIW